MPDGGTCADEKVLQLLETLIQELEGGRVALAFVWGPSEVIIKKKKKKHRDPG